MICIAKKKKVNFRPSSAVFLILLLWFSPEDEAIVEVHVPGSENKEAIFRKRTVGILDMGGVSTQIAYEVPKTVSFASSQQVIICATSFFSFWFIFMRICWFGFPYCESCSSLHRVPKPRQEKMANTNPSSAKHFICILFI